MKRNAPQKRKIILFVSCEYLPLHHFFPFQPYITFELSPNSIKTNVHRRFKLYLQRLALNTTFRFRSVIS